ESPSSNGHLRVSNVSVPWKGAARGAREETAVRGAAAAAPLASGSPEHRLPLFYKGLRGLLVIFGPATARVPDRLGIEDGGQIGMLRQIHIFLDIAERNRRAVGEPFRQRLHLLLE